jgi:hypothetical protein
MLNFSDLNVLRDAAKGMPEADKVALASCGLAEQSAKIRSLRPAVPQDTCAAFVLWMNAKLGKISGPSLTAARVTLGLPPTTTKWPWPRPPRNSFEAFDEVRGAKEWYDLFTAAKGGELAKQVSYEEASVPEALIAAVKNYAKIGGYEDLQDSSAIQAADKTMGMLLEALDYGVMIVNPQWYDKDSGNLLKSLPAGIDPRAFAVVDAELKAKVEAQRAADRAAKVEARRESDRAKYKEIKTNALAALYGKHKVDLDTISGVLAKAPIEELFKMIDEAGDGTWLNGVLQTTAASALPGTDAAAANHFMEQAILTKVSEAKPHWFRTLVTGDLACRPAEPKSKVGLNKKQKSVRRALYAFVDKYGAALTLAEIQAVFTGVKAENEAVAPVPAELSETTPEADKAKE